jgi:Fe-S oxidoreductase
MSLLKAELLQAQIRSQGLSLRQRLFSSVDLLGRVGCLAPRLATRLLESVVGRHALGRLLGIAWERPMPPYTSNRFDHWFARHVPEQAQGRGRVLLWDDTFVRYHEPHIGIAAVKVLEAAGFQVQLVKDRKCCGRPAFSQGNVEQAKALGRHNLMLLSRDADAPPILFLEPSCYSMFVEEYLEMRLEGAEEVAKRCFLFEQFIEALLTQEPDALQFTAEESRIVIHCHCHTKALTNPVFLERLAGRLPGREVQLLEAGCCGMAGAFGMLESKYELSLKVAEPLMQQIRGQPFGTVMVASGTSCRHQIQHLAPVHPRHMAEVLAEALVRSA